MCNKKGGRIASKLLNDEFQNHICLDFECTTIEEAIRKAGDLLVQCGCVKTPYIDGMIRREQEHPTSIGFHMAQKILLILFFSLESVSSRFQMVFLIMTRS